MMCEHCWVWRKRNGAKSKLKAESVGSLVCVCVWFV
jgi:hypothetical protein